MSNYNLLEKIDEGSFSAVYKAERKSDGKLVALKKQRIDYNDNGLECYFLRELSILANVEHKNALKLQGCFYENKRLYVITDLYKTDLYKYILNFHPKNNYYRDIQYFMGQLLEGLNYLHSVDVVHRDIKPQNIFVDYEEKKIVFGDVNLSRILSSKDVLTTEVCSFCYRAPEVFYSTFEPVKYLVGKKGKYDPKKLDVWSLGCVFGEMVHTRQLFPGDSEIDQLLKIHNFSHKQIKNTEKIDEKWFNIICKMLEKDPSKRPFVHELQSFDEKYTLKDTTILNIDYSHQTEITAQMRLILVDWLFEVHKTYRMDNNVIFLAVNYLDRYLAKNNVTKDKLQLIGCACLFIAGKYDELYPPDVDDYVFISNNLYTKEQILDMEIKILETLDYNLYCDLITKKLKDYTKPEMYFAKLSLVGIERKSVFETLNSIKMILEKKELDSYAKYLLKLHETCKTPKRTGIAELRKNSEYNE